MSEVKSTQGLKTPETNIYIRAHEAENLYKLLPTLKDILESLKITLNSISIDKDEGIYAASMATKIPDGSVPTCGNVSDKTGNLAISHPLRAKSYRKELTEDILKLSTIIQKVELAFNSLSKRQRSTIELYYLSEMTWAMVVDALKNDKTIAQDKRDITIRTAKEERKKAIRKMVSISKVLVEDYNYVIKLVDGES